MGLEPTNLLTASQALYQLSYAPEASHHVSKSSSGPRSPIPLGGGSSGPATWLSFDRRCPKTSDGRR
jgi:hypothetical protein